MSQNDPNKNAVQRKLVTVTQKYIWVITETSDQDQRKPECEQVSAYSVQF